MEELLAEAAARRGGRRRGRRSTKETSGVGLEAVVAAIGLVARAVGVTDVRVRLVGPVGLAVAYPGDGKTRASNADASLNEGEKDVAAVRIDAAKLAPGHATARWSSCSTARCRASSARSSWW